MKNSKEFAEMARKIKNNEESDEKMYKFLHPIAKNRYHQILPIMKQQDSIVKSNHSIVVHKLKEISDADAKYRSKIPEVQNRYSDYIVSREELKNATSRDNVVMLAANMAEKSDWVITLLYNMLLEIDKIKETGLELNGLFCYENDKLMDMRDIIYKDSILKIIEILLRAELEEAPEVKRLIKKMMMNTLIRHDYDEEEEIMETEEEDISLIGNTPEEKKIPKKIKSRIREISDDSTVYERKQAIMTIMQKIWEAGGRCDAPNIRKMYAGTMTDAQLRYILDSFVRFGEVVAVGKTSNREYISKEEYKKHREDLGLKTDDSETEEEQEEPTETEETSEGPNEDTDEEPEENESETEGVEEIEEKEE